MEYDPWTANDAELKKQWEAEYALLRAKPEYKKYVEDKDYLCDVLVYILFDADNEFEEDQKNSPSENSITRHSTISAPNNSKKPSRHDGNLETQAFQEFQRRERSFGGCIRQYASTFRSSPWDAKSYDRSDPLRHIGRHRMDTLAKEIARGAKSFDLGYSLYIYQQMYDRKKVPEPSFSKAAWLLKHTPLQETKSGRLVARSKWEVIQEQWRFHVKTAHYWAALIALMKPPLEYNSDLLLDFVCQADANKFKELATAFYDFRKRVEIPRKSSKQGMYIKDLLWSHEEAQHIDPLDIPDPLQPFQWDALSQYTAPKRPFP